MSDEIDILREGALNEYLDDQGVLGLIDWIKEGLKFSVFNRIASNSHFTLGEWSFFLNISERTLQRYKRDKKSFDKAQSERIIQIQMIQQLGKEVFGRDESFNQWLELKNLALQGRKPKDFLDSSFGINLVRDELRRIEHGVLA